MSVCARWAPAFAHPAGHTFDVTISALLALRVVPELGVGLGPGRVPGAAVPDLSAVGRAEAETAVHKHRGLALGLRVRQLFRSGEYYISTRFIAGLVWCIDN